jgi:hypothetical protein
MTRGSSLRRQVDLVPWKIDQIHVIPEAAQMHRWGGGGAPPFLKEPFGTDPHKCLLGGTSESPPLVLSYRNLRLLFIDSRETLGCKIGKTTQSPLRFLCESFFSLFESLKGIGVPSAWPHVRGKWKGCPFHLPRVPSSPAPAILRSSSKSIATFLSYGAKQILVRIIERHDSKRLTKWILRSESCRFRTGLNAGPS